MTKKQDLKVRIIVTVLFTVIGLSYFGIEICKALNIFPTTYRYSNIDPTRDYILNQEKKEARKLIVDYIGFVLVLGIGTTSSYQLRDK